MRECFNPSVYKDQWQYEEDGLTVTRTCQWSAPGCHQGCSVLWYTDEEGKLVKVEGDPRSPVTDGRLCMRCLNMVEAVYHPDRIIHPLKRVGERGENKWERITMDEAYQIVVDMAKDITARYGSKAIAVGTGTGRNATWQTPVLKAGGFKTPNDNLGFLAGSCCFTPRLEAMNSLFGDTLIADCGQLNELRFDEPEYRRPDLFIVWGNNSIRTNADGFLGHWIVDCMKIGSELLVVDPQVTWMAAHAKCHLQLRPGTDAALAMAIMNIMIEEDLYDHEFVENWCYGFEALADRVKTMPPARAAEITWVPVEKIYEAARLIGTCGTTALQWGLPLDQQKNADGAAHAVACLQALTGNIDVPGGWIVINYGYVQSDIRENISRGIPHSSEGRIGANGQWGKMMDDKSPHCQPEAILHAVETGDPYPIKMAFLCSTTSFTNMAGDAKRVFEAFKNFEYVVCCDLFMTPTAVAYADLFIPMAFGCERNGIRGWYTPVRSIVQVTKTGDAVGDEELMLELGKRLDPDIFYWDDVPEMLEFCSTEMATLPITFTLDELREKVYIYPRFEYNKYRTGKLRRDGNLGFNTLTGRCELYCTRYDMVGMDPLPYYLEPPSSPYSTPEDFEKYPFVLTTGRRSWEYFHSEYRQMPTMREFHPWPIVEINDEDAETIGVKENDWVLLENANGQAKFCVHVTPTILKGVVSAEHGWWFPERQAEAPDYSGVFESNANCLTRQDDFGPSGYGSTYKTQICSVTKIDYTPEPISFLQEVK